MKAVWVILRRSLRRWMVFLLLLAAPVTAAQLSKTETPPPAGLYMPENDPVSQRIAAHLTANGFIRYQKPDALAELVRMENWTVRWSSRKDWLSGSPGEN